MRLLPNYFDLNYFLQWNITTNWIDELKDKLLRSVA